MQQGQVIWRNLVFLAVAHLLAALALVLLLMGRFSPWSLLLAGVWMALASISITGGYHRLFSHSTYRAAWPLRLLYLLFGAASVQNSALNWSADHRRHHAHTDRELDPYNVQKGFWWAHLGWIVVRDGNVSDRALVRDLESDVLLRLQDRFYLPLVVLMIGVLPLGLGLIWGDPLGALLLAGFLRLVIQYHMTFSVNSVAHMLGSKPYSQRTSARDSWITALLTLGEGYHNFHHRFQGDYRNGVRWFHFDPTKWFIWTMGRLGVAKGLRRASRDAIARARASTLGPALEARSA